MFCNNERLGTGSLNSMRSHEFITEWLIHVDKSVYSINLHRTDTHTHTSVSFGCVVRPWLIRPGGFVVGDAPDDPRLVTRQFALGRRLWFRRFGRLGWQRLLFGFGGFLFGRLWRRFNHRRLFTGGFYCLFALLAVGGLQPYVSQESVAVLSISTKQPRLWNHSLLTI